MRSHAKATAGEATKLRAGRGLVLTGSLLVVLIVAAVGATGALAAAPTVPSTSVSAVSTDSAVLRAEINPEGEATTYHFEYGLEDCSLNPCMRAPLPDGNVGSGSEPRAVAKEVTGLDSGTAYHYRAVATNASGTIAGPDQIFTTYSPPERRDCSNDSRRLGPAVNTADCRAYEMVSPVDKNSADIKTLCNINCYRTAVFQVAEDGESFTYSSYKSFADTLSTLYSNQFIASRGGSGWSTHAVNPEHLRTPFSPEYSTQWDLDVEYKAFSADLSTAWYTDDSIPPLAPGGVEGEINLLERDNSTDSWTAISPWDPIAFGAGRVEVKGNSPSGDHMLYTSGKALTPEAPSDETLPKLYDYTGGDSVLVSILPNGEPTEEYAYLGWPNSGGNGRQDRIGNAVSGDGSHVFWTVTDTGFGGDGKIYVRIDGAETVPVSESVSAADARYWEAASDGSAAVFSIGEDLYRFDVESETSTLIAGGSYGVMGASDDIAYVYFVSKEVLAPGASEGGRNVYLDHEGAKTFIGTVSQIDTGEGQSIEEVSGYNLAAVSSIDQPTRVSDDGSSLAFQSVVPLTGYDNTDVNNGEPDTEVFIYDASADNLSCASCRPSGGRPTGQPFQLSFRADEHPANNNGGEKRLS